MKGVAFLFISLLALWAQIASCEVTQFEGLEIPPNSALESTVVMYTTKDAPLQYVVNESSISWTFRATTKVPNTKMNYTVLLFHSDATQYIGTDTPDGRRVCCNEDLKKAGKCENGELGGLIINNKVFESNLAIYNVFTFTNFSETFSTIGVRSTGVYRLWFLNCAKQKEPAPEDIDALTIVLGSDQTFLNPYGHLSGESVPLFPFYFLIMCFFFVVSLIWTIMLIRYREGLVYLQYLLSFVLYITFLECLILAFDYYNYNNTGVLSMAFNVIEVLIGTAKRTSEWIALMTVCYGYTVIYPEMGKKFKYPLIIAAIIYAIVYFVYNILFTVKFTPATDTSGIPETLVVLLLIVLTVFDFAFICWIFYNLFNSLAFLKLRNQPQKFKMFKTLAIVLGIAYVCAFIFFCVQVAGIYGGMFDSWWRGWWCFTAFWPTLELVIMTAIAIIWRPNPHNSRYAYSAQLMDQDPSRGVELPKVGDEDPEKSEHEVADKSETDTASQSTNSQRGESYNDL